CLQYSISPFTF
nr:immunoglobulin light chain junction region [Macaca mulatta]MOW08590.1 immunoglobulin light chain junction region [Macaca mulatta]MOW08599.1 immunoglobulin light chain junction region [Macaca mulatta]MOW08617.1 immunoglobulin light chain junction region [Macaca mulatta]MOW08884.1 immunoglobulin light chain junction region [Macaca mulatta]